VSAAVTAEEHASAQLTYCQTAGHSRHLHIMCSGAHDHLFWPSRLQQLLCCGTFNSCIGHSLKTLSDPYSSAPPAFYSLLLASSMPNTVNAPITGPACCGLMLHKCSLGHHHTYPHERSLLRQCRGAEGWPEDLDAVHGGNSAQNGCNLHVCFMLCTVNIEPRLCPLLVTQPAG